MSAADVVWRRGSFAWHARAHGCALRVGTETDTDVVRSVEVDARAIGGPSTRRDAVGIEVAHARAWCERWAAWTAELVARERDATSGPTKRGS